MPRSASTSCPPELREDASWIRAASEAPVPQLVRLADLQGCFHCHTSASDGTATVAEMAEAARARGWRYLRIADHSPAAYYAGGLSPDAILQQHEETDAWNVEQGAALWLFKGIEADILADGTVDLAESGLLGNLRLRGRVGALAVPDERRADDGTGAARAREPARHHARAMPPAACCSTVTATSWTLRP